MSQWQWTIVELIITIFESGFLYYWFLGEKFKTRYTGIRRVALMVIFPTATYVFDFFINEKSIKLLLLFGVGILVSWVLYNCTFMQALIWNLVFMCVLVASECIAMGYLLFIHGEKMISAFLDHSFFRIQCVILSKMINVIFLAICVNFLKIENKKYSVKQLWIFILQGLSSILCLITLVELSYCHVGNFSWNMIFLTILGIVELTAYIVSYYCTDKYFISKDQEEELLKIKLKNEKLLSNYKKFEETQKQVYKLYHDSKKHMDIIKWMESREDAEDYIMKCMSDARRTEGIFQSGNPYIDMFLYDEWEKATNAGIIVQYAIEKGSLEGIEIQDAVAILGNALENAREACEKEVEKSRKLFIQLKIVKIGSQVIFVISNSYNANVVLENGELQTSKKNKKLHGIGTKSIRAAVENYHGYMSSSHNNDKFVLKIILNV